MLQDSNEGSQEGVTPTVAPAPALRTLSPAKSPSQQLKRKQQQQALEWQRGSVRTQSRYHAAYYLQHSVFSKNKKIMRHAKKPKSVTPTQDRKQATDTATEGTWSYSVDKGFQATIINMYKKLKEIMIKELQQNPTGRASKNTE